MKVVLTARWEKRKKEKRKGKIKREQKKESEVERIERDKEKGLDYFYIFGLVNPKFSGDNHPLSTPNGG